MSPHQLLPLPDLHSNANHYDGLIIAKWSRALFEDMRNGWAETAANCSGISLGCYFQGYDLTHVMVKSAHVGDSATWYARFKYTEDIPAGQARRQELGIHPSLFRTAHAFEDQIGYVEIFKRLGVGIRADVLQPEPALVPVCLRSAMVACPDLAAK